MGSRARAFLAAPHIVSCCLATLVEFDSETYDSDSEFDTTTHRFTATNAGFYLVTAHIGASGMGNGDGISIAIHKNGAQVSSHTDYSEKLSGFRTVEVEVSDILQLGAGDFVDIRATAGASGTRSLITTSQRTWLSIHRLS